MAKLAPGWKKISEFVFRSPEGKRVGYAEYRQITGLCDVCGVAIIDHPCCEACGILTGLGHLESCSNYREHNICGHCVSHWRGLDKKVGRETTLEELKNPHLLRRLPAKRGEPYHLIEDNEDPVNDKEREEVKLAGGIIS